MATTRNIIIGAANIFLTKSDSTVAGYTIPDPFAVTTTGSFNDAVNQGTGKALDSAKWNNVGFTSDGLEVTYEPTYGEVEVDQQLDVAKLFKSSQRVMLKTTFTEATLKNLLIVFGLKESQYSGADTAEESILLGIGALNEEPTERALVAVGNAPRTSTNNNDRERIYYARRVLSVESSSHSLKRNEATLFPVTFRLLGDPSYSDAYGKIVDRLN
jgi:hypothetical protein